MHGRSYTWWNTLTAWTSHQRDKHFCSYDWLPWIKDLGKTSGRVTNMPPWLPLYEGDRYLGRDRDTEREREREREREIVCMCVWSFPWCYTKACQVAAAGKGSHVCACVRLWLHVCKMWVLLSHLTSHNPLMAGSLRSVAEWIRLFTSSLFGPGQTSSNSLIGVEGGCYT